SSLIQACSPSTPSRAPWRFVPCCTSREFSSFLFSYTAPSVTYPLSLHDALPIYSRGIGRTADPAPRLSAGPIIPAQHPELRIHSDRKSTRLNSSHVKISYAVFCLNRKTHLRNLRENTTAPTTPSQKVRFCPAARG